MAVTYFVATTGADTNGGSSEGAAKASGAGAATTTASSTVNLTADTPNLSTVVPGDAIRLNGRTDGINSTDVFEILTVNDGADTITVSPTPGSDTSGVTWAIGGAIATIDRAMNLIRDGEKSWVKATADYTETATIDRAATATTPIIFEGYTSTTGDGGRVTINGSASRASGLLDGLSSATSVNYLFKNFRFTNHTSHGVNCDVDNVTFKNCRFDDNVGSGCNGGDRWTFENCDASDNDVAGITVVSNGCFIGCRAFNNGTRGLNSTSGAVFLFCECFNNATEALRAGGASTDVFICVNCTIDGNADATDVGIQVNAGIATVVIMNNIIYDCTLGATQTTVIGERAIVRNNLINANATAYTGLTSSAGDVTGAPNFINEGSNDYRLATASPAVDAGFDGSANTATGNSSSIDIGAHQRGGTSGAGGSGAGYKTGGGM